MLAERDRLAADVTLSKKEYAQRGCKEYDTVTGAVLTAGLEQGVATNTAALQKGHEDAEETNDVAELLQHADEKVRVCLASE